MKWFVGDWKKNPKVRLLTAESKGVWLEILCAMHELDSYELMGTIRELSKQSGVEKDEMERSLIELEKYEVANIVRDKSQVVTVVSRRRMKEAEMREYESERKKKYRESIKEKKVSRHCPDNVPLSDSDSVSVSKKNKKKVWTKIDIETLYQKYPRKVGKRAALTAIENALTRCASRTGIDPLAFLTKRVEAFAASPVGQGDYCPNPSTWFNQDRFDDDTKEWARTTEKTNDLITYSEMLTAGGPTGFEMVRQNGSQKPLWRRGAAA